ncbi:MAG: twin-arginine translocation signal domain-containing protein, partial [Proteiniphilum sp.]
METRREFIRKAAMGAAGLTIGSNLHMSARSYANIMGA